MKSLRLIASSAVVASSMAVAPMPATAQGNSYIVALCKAYIDAGGGPFASTVGECVGGINKYFNELCKAYWEAAGFKNNGQCQSYIKQFLHSL